MTRMGCSKKVAFSAALFVAFSLITAMIVLS